MQAVLKAQINKTDRNGARGIAQMIRVGLYRPVHVKTLRLGGGGDTCAAVNPLTRRPTAWQLNRARNCRAKRTR
jgi:hypothetical protein